MAGPDRQIWLDILAHVRDHHVGVCRKWFHDLEPVRMDRGALVVRAPQAAQRQYLERECANAFNEAAQAVTGMLVSVRFVGEAGGAAPAHEPHKRPARTGADHPDAEHAPEPHTNGRHPNTHHAPSASRERAPGELPLSPDYTFDSFVMGPENRLAHAAAIAVADNPGRAYNPIFLHGGVGLGKTHLLQAISHRILEATPTAVIHYVSCEAFITQFMESVQGGQMAGFRHRFRDVDVLVIDDIHFLAKRDQTQEEFFHTFNTLYQEHKQIVLSSDAPPDQIPDLEERLVSRFKWGLVAQIERPGYETRVTIVQKKAELRGMSLPKEVAAAIASRIESNVRELEGTVVRIQAQAAAEKRPVDLALAETVLGEISPRPPAQILITTIIDTVSDFFNVKIPDLQSKRRQKSIAQPRQVCMFLARKHTPHSLQEIGGYFGGRDHTTVLHAERTIESRIAKDAQFAGVVRTIEAKLMPGGVR